MIWHGICVLCLLLGSIAPGEVLAQRWILVYAGGSNHLHQSASNIEHLFYSQLGSSSRRLFDGVVYLDTRSPSGHNLLSWASGPPDPSDYASYLDTLMSPRGALAIADSISRSHSDTLLVALMIPYPLGKVTRSPASDSRVTFIASYIARAESLYASRHFQSLRLWGFYWLPENVSPNDTAIVQHFTTIVHWHGLRALWIPYYLATLTPRWRNLGFDSAILQPNYYMGDSIGPERLDSALSRAMAWGMGLEVEFDRRLLTEPKYVARLNRYMEVLESGKGREHIQVVAVYDGAGALWDLAGARDEELKAVYGRLVHLLEAR